MEIEYIKTKEEAFFETLLSQKMCVLNEEKFVCFLCGSEIIHNDDHCLRNHKQEYNLFKNIVYDKNINSNVKIFIYNAFLEGEGCVL